MLALHVPGVAVLSSPSVFMESRGYRTSSEQYSRIHAFELTFQLRTCDGTAWLAGVDQGMHSFACWHCRW